MAARKLIFTVRSQDFPGVNSHYVDDNHDEHGADDNNFNDSGSVRKVVLVGCISAMIMMTSAFFHVGYMFYLCFQCCQTHFSVKVVLKALRFSCWYPTAVPLGAFVDVNWQMFVLVLNGRKPTSENPENVDGDRWIPKTLWLRQEVMFSISKCCEGAIKYHSGNDFGELHTLCHLYTEFSGFLAWGVLWCLWQTMECSSVGSSFPKRKEQTTRSLSLITLHRT